jgi:hypothetical protein
MMKLVAVGLALQVGMVSLGQAQTSDRPVHPGTALLDSMGIVAGAPDPGPTDKPPSAAASSGVVATPTRAELDKR